MKSFIAPLFEPLGAVWLLMALGTLWLLWRKQRRSAAWLGSPTLLVLLLGSTPLAEILVRRAEQPYAPQPSASQPPADAVVALGGGHEISNYDLLGFATRDAGSRLLTAVELVRQGRAKTLVLGGSWPMAERPGVPQMSVVQNWVAAWHLTSGAMTNLGVCKDTHDEALACRGLRDAHGWQRVILVTSALHLQRSVAVFEKAGVAVVPVAADFQVAGVPQTPGQWSPFPRQGRFELLSLYSHEVIGWWVYRWRGWI